jgi:hypothetical protein
MIIGEIFELLDILGQGVVSGTQFFIRLLLTGSGVGRI